MSVIIHFPARAKEPFRLDGRADRIAGTRTRRLLTTREALTAVSDLRKTQDSQELKDHENVLQQKLTRETAYIETLANAFRVAERAAPHILRDTTSGDEGALVVTIRHEQSRKVEAIAAFQCTSRGVVLVANDMLILPKRSRRMTL